MNTISAKELRLNLKQILDRVASGEEFTVIYKSKPLAQLIKVKQENRFNFDAFEEAVNEVRKQYIPDSTDNGKTYKEIYHEILDKKYSKYLPESNA